MAVDAALSDELYRRAAPAREAHRPYVIGVGGSVAVGKSTFANELRAAIEAWDDHPGVDVVGTDGFLFPNRVLEERKISMRKGFPESYDVEHLRSALTDIRAGKRVAVPRYSHVAYDIDPGDPQIVENPGVLILDGLHLAQIESPGVARLIDCLLYLDAEEDAIEAWFTARLIPLMVAGQTDEKSFYYAFREMDDAGRTDFAKRVWNGINLPNLREHIVRDRSAADVIVFKQHDHTVARATWQR